MYVSRLDRPWCETPFPIQGFHLRSDEDIEKVRQYCRWVMVDFQLSRNVRYHVDPALDRKINKKPKDKGDGKKQIAAKPITVKRNTYKRTSTVVKEVKAAKKIQEHVVAALDNLLTCVENGMPVDLAETKTVAKEVVNSVVRNPDALVWLTRIKSVDNHTFGQSINCMVWATVFGRHLGLPIDRLEILVTAAMLCKVGITRLPDSLLEKEELDEQEQKILQGYVVQSIDLVSHIPDLSKEVMTIVATHKERVDGTGYPNGLVGDQIPELGRIVGIVVEYEELTNPRFLMGSVTPSEAMSKIYGLRESQFQADLVEEFIRSIGIYPAGCLVELNTHEVGIITERNEDRRLRPKVMIVLDEQKDAYEKHSIIDLNEQSVEKDEGHLEIVRALPKGSFGIDPSSYLISGAKSVWSLKHLLAR